MTAVIVKFPQSRGRINQSSRNVQEAEYHRAFARRLRLLRALLKLTEAGAAADHGVTLQTYRRWEAGGRSRRWLRAMLKFCKKHDVRYEFYIAGEGAIFNDVA